jgi:hypothetical protein
VGRYLIGKKKKRTILGLYFPGTYLCVVCGTYINFKESCVNGKMPRKLVLKYVSYYKQLLFLHLLYSEINEWKIDSKIDF